MSGRWPHPYEVGWASGNHPDIHYIENETCALCRTGAGIMPHEKAQGVWERAARRLKVLDDAAATSGARRWVEKTPSHVKCGFAFHPILCTVLGYPRAGLVALVHTVPTARKAGWRRRGGRG